MKIVIRNSYFLILAITLVIIVAVLAVPFGVGAQQNPPDDINFDAGLMVAPALLEADITQGKSTSEIFELTNKIDKNVAIKSYIRTFDASDEIGGIDIFDKVDADKLSPQNWIKISEPDFVLKPNGSHQVKLTFKAPADLSPGGHYAVLFFEPQVEGQEKPSSIINVGGRVGALLFLTAAGDIKESSELVSFHTTPVQIFRTPLPYIIRAKDTGNVHTKISGTITVKNILWFKKKEIAVPQFTILPQKIRKQEVANEIKKIPGIYKADLRLISEDGKTQLQSKVFFIYLSWPYLIGLIIIIFIVGYYGLNAPRRRRLVAAVRVLFARK